MKLPGGMRRLRRVRDLSPREDVERELRLHLELRAEELVAAGWEPGAARAEAERLFGPYAEVRDACEGVARRQAQTRRRSNMWSELWQDVRYAGRGMRQQPGFTALAVLTLGLGMGANSAAFSLVNGVLLSPLSYPEPQELVQLWERTPRSDEVAVAWPNFRDWKARASTVRSMTAYTGTFTETILGGTEPVRVPITLVARDFLRTVGVAPRLGRDFSDEEQTPGGGAAVLVSERFWREHLGATPRLEGVQLRLLDAVASVVGVLPAGAALPADADVWVAAQRRPESEFGSRTAHNFRVVARLAAGQTPASARAELNTIAQTVRAEFPDTDAEGVTVVPLHAELVGDASRPLLLFFGASALVLLIACTNLASALLARATARERELAVRAALGAHRLRLVRQLLTENLVLALLGAAVGLLLAWGVLQLLAAWGAGAIPRLADVTIDGRVTAFAALVAVLTALLFGLLPALRAARRTPLSALREGERGGYGRGRARAWSVLVGVEIALALVLLAGAGLLVRSFWNVVQTDPGFQPGGTITAAVSLPGTRYPEETDRVRFYDEVLAQVRALPGVKSAGLTNSLPLQDRGASGTFWLPGQEEGAGDAGYRVVSPAYFEAMGIPLLRGRMLEEQDRPGSPAVVVINQAMADRFFGGDALGQRFSTGGMDMYYDTLVTVVGVVGDVRHRSLLTPPAPEYYLPYAQRPPRISAMTLVVRPERDAGELPVALRRIIRGIDDQVPVEIDRLGRQVTDSVADRRFALALIGGFAALALLLAALGIYAVVAYAAARRTREIGIRIALGARRGEVLGVLGRVVAGAILAGTVAGFVGAALVTRLLESMLWGVSALDPLTFVFVALVLLAAAALAVLLPARRALRIDPMLAMRSE